MGLTAVIAIVGSQFYEFIEVLVPYVQGDGSTALAFTQLVNSDSGIVIKASPRDNAAGGVFKASDVGVEGPYLAQVDTQGTTVLGYAGEFGVYIVNGPEVVVHAGDETGGQLVELALR